MSARHREIGSDFELVDPRLVLTEASPPPWERRSEDTFDYYESGRQALAAVEARLRGAHARSRLVVPEYLCDTMIQPFDTHGWQIVPVPVDALLTVRPEHVTAAASPPETTVILNAPYFGRDSTPEMIGTLGDLRAIGCLVITDETHRPLSAPTPVSDFRVASLRKLLPVPDGAYAARLPTSDPPETTAAQADTDTVLSDLRLRAMGQKSKHLGRPDPARAHLAAFRRAEALVDDRTEPRPMSSASRDLLRHLDYEAIRRRRRSNALALERALDDTGVEIINRPAPDLLPSHLVVAVPDPGGLRNFLIERDIFCPIHWPRSEILTEVSWPQRYLSLPIDQRYGDGDMDRIAQAVSDYFTST